VPRSPRSLLPTPRSSVTQHVASCANTAAPLCPRSNEACPGRQQVPRAAWRVRTRGHQAARWREWVRRGCSARFLWCVHPHQTHTNHVHTLTHTHLRVYTIKVSLHVMYRYIRNICVNMHLCIDVCMYVCMYDCLTYAHTHDMNDSRAHAHTHTLTRARTHTHTHNTHRCRRHAARVLAV
jgi:hypothetical protein